MDASEIIDDEFWTINTFVFLDLETTGLIKEYEPLPKVTELALIAVSRDNFLNCKNSMPRVLHKLTLPINPNMDIPTIVQNITKLTRESLKSEKDFNYDTYTTVKHFINRLTQPICLVSHNGNRFDFPLLLNEFRSVKQDFLIDFPKSLLCLDTFIGFKDILKNPRQDLHDESEINLMNSQSTYRHSNDHTYPKNYFLNPNINSRIGNGKKNEGKMFSPKKIENHKLPTVYKYLYGCSPEQEHNAEGDCLTLIKCCLKVKEQFVCWADLNASLFKNFQLTHAILQNCY